MKKVVLLAAIAGIAMLFAGCEEIQKSGDDSSSSDEYMNVSELTPLFCMSEQAARTYLENMGYSGRYISYFDGIDGMLNEMEASESMPLYRYQKNDGHDNIVVAFCNDSAVNITYYASKGYTPKQVSSWLIHPGNRIFVNNWDSPLYFLCAAIEYDLESKNPRKNDEFESISSLEKRLSSLQEDELVEVAWRDNYSEGHERLALELFYVYQYGSDLAVIEMGITRRKNDPVVPQPVEPDPIFQSLISVEDYTMEDWLQVPAAYLVKLKQQGNTIMGGLDSIWVYADKCYLNLLVWPCQDSLTNKDLVPFHIFLNADGDNRTGGYDDWFDDGNAEWLMEGFLYESNATCKYIPALFQWWGSMGGGITDQSSTTGWLWTDPSKPHSAEDGWGAIIPAGSLPLGNSQALNQNKVFEIQILRSLITKNWAETFGVGFDIERAGGDETAPWVLVGVLPNPVEEVGSGATIKAPKAMVTVDFTHYSSNFQK